MPGEELSEGNEETAGSEHDEVTVVGSKAGDAESDEDDDSNYNNPHCTINFVKNTQYKLVDTSFKHEWATATLTDPAPAVPTSLNIIKAGDYVLVKGKDIKRKKNNRGKSVPVTFVASDELVLTNKWEQFDEDMTGDDLKMLDQKTFLLWWQNVEPPKVKMTKKRKA